LSAATLSGISLRASRVNTGTRCVMAAACDVRVMAAGTIGLTEVSAGVPFPPAALEIMRHVAGPTLGELVLTAAPLDAAAARSVGLIHAIEAPETLLDSVIARAQSMLRLPAEVFAFSKRQLQRTAPNGSRSREVTPMPSRRCGNRSLPRRPSPHTSTQSGGGKPRLAEG